MKKIEIFSKTDSCPDTIILGRKIFFGKIIFIIAIYWAENILKMKVFCLLFGQIGKKLALSYTGRKTSNFEDLL